MSLFRLLMVLVIGPYFMKKNSFFCCSSGTGDSASGYLIQGLSLISFDNGPSPAGGWKLELPDGKTKTFTGLFLSANWFMRSSIDLLICSWASNRQGWPRHSGREGWLLFAFVDEAGLWWRIHSGHGRLQRQVGILIIQYIDILRICVIIAHVMELKLFRWIILQEQEEFQRFHENVESVACSCGPAQRERDIVDILKNWSWRKTLF